MFAGRVRGGGPSRTTGKRVQLPPGGQVFEGVLCSVTAPIQHGCTPDIPHVSCNHSRCLQLVQLGDWLWNQQTLARQKKEHLMKVQDRYAECNELWLESGTMPSWFLDQVKQRAAEAYRVFAQQKSYFDQKCWSFTELQHELQDIKDTRASHMDRCLQQDETERNSAIAMGAAQIAEGVMSALKKTAPTASKKRRRTTPAADQHSVQVHTTFLPQISLFSIAVCMGCRGNSGTSLPESLLVTSPMQL